MLTRKDAIEAVRKTLPIDFDVLEEQVIEKEYGWVIFSQTKRCIKTKNPTFRALGSGGTLVEKNTGRLIKFGSAHSTEINLRIYEAGYLAHDDFDLVVTAISNPEEAVGLLSELRITYVKPESESGTTWRTPKEYSAQRLRDRLRNLPCRFNLGSLYFMWEVLERMKNSASLKFELKENRGFRNEI